MTHIAKTLRAKRAREQAAPVLKNYRVILAWEQEDEGNYCDVFEAPDEAAAKRMCAEAMLDAYSDVYEDYTPEEREQWILDRMAACDDISIDRESELQARVDSLEAAAKAIVYQRDYFAEHGRYDDKQPNPHAEPDQEFDDWAADILEAALAA